MSESIDVRATIALLDGLEDVTEPVVGLHEPATAVYQWRPTQPVDVRVLLAVLFCLGDGHDPLELATRTLVPEPEEPHQAFSDSASAEISSSRTLRVPMICSGLLMNFSTAFRRMIHAFRYLPRSFDTRMYSPGSIMFSLSQPIASSASLMIGSELPRPLHFSWSLSIRSIWCQNLLESGTS